MGKLDEHMEAADSAVMVGNNAAQVNVLKNKWLRFLRLREAQGMRPIEAKEKLSGPARGGR